jgi:prepilin-type N-terminal cleavage/methylation domain-containing protein
MSTVGRSTRIGRAGFTLFELLVVIAVLAVAAGLVVPNIDLGPGRGGVEDAVKCVRSAMDQARTQARLRSENVTVRFGPASVTVLSGDRVIDFPGGVRFEGILHADDQVRTDRELIVDRRGMVPASIVRLRVEDQLYSLMISPIMRDVEYKEGAVDFRDFAE